MLPRPLTSRARWDHVCRPLDVNENSSCGEPGDDAETGRVDQGCRVHVERDAAAAEAVSVLDTFEELGHGCEIDLSGEDDGRLLTVRVEHDREGCFPVAHGRSLSTSPLATSGLGNGASRLERGAVPRAEVCGRFVGRLKEREECCIGI